MALAAGVAPAGLLACWLVAVREVLLLQQEHLIFWPIAVIDAESGEHEIYFEKDKTTEYLNLKEQRKHKWQIFPYKET